MVASALPLSTPQTRQRISGEIAQMKRRNAQTRGGAVALGMRIDALARRGFQFPAGGLASRDQMFRLIAEMDRLEAGVDSFVIEAARRDERNGYHAPGTVDNALRRGVGEPITLIVVGTIIAIVGLVAGIATIGAVAAYWISQQGAISTAAANAASQQLIVNALVRDWERRAAATPPGSQPPPAPTVPSIPFPPPQPGFGSEFGKATSGLALLLAVGAGIYILAGRR